MRNVVLAGALALAGCTYQSSNINSILSEAPRDPYTNTTWAVACLGKSLDRIQASRPGELPKVVVYIDNFVDGTIPQSVNLNGPLGDRGRFDFSAILGRYISNSLVLVPYEEPGFMKASDQVTGAADPVLMAAALNSYGATGAYKIRGAFTQFDPVDVNDVAYGANGNLQDPSNNNIRGETTVGVRAASRTITLSVEVGAPVSNIVVGANSFAVNIHNDAYDYSFGIGNDFFSFTVNHEETYQESVHAAQRTLLEAASMWLLYAIYEDSLNTDPQVESCFSGLESASYVAARSKEWNALNKAGKMAAIQRLLKKAGHYNGSVGSADEQAVLQAAASYARTSADFTLPTAYGIGDLWHLYLALSKEHGELT